MTCRFFLLLLSLLSMAHVGSPDTFFAGDAGPYPIRVIVRLPGVIPGRAQITVRVAGAVSRDIRAVSIRTAHWTTGVEGAPPADTAVQVPGDPELYSTEVWFMGATSYRLFVTVDGSEGTGTAIVPTLALATEERRMNPNLGLVLVGLAAFLFVGMLTIVGCAVRESGLPVGTVPDASRKRRARVVTAAAAVLLGAALWGGNKWWAAEASAYGNFVVYRPFKSEASARLERGRPQLTLGIRDDRWPERPNPLGRLNALMPDHGKLMHMFLVREPALDAFAHVHPVPRTPSAHDFDVALPPLPPGRYRVYGDIVHESGYAQTLVAAADVPDATTTASSGDPDDSFFVGAPAPEGAAPVFRLSDGSTITWSRGETALVAGEERLLTFAAADASGRPLTLEPYMGMMGHAALVLDDGSVFVHLHPSGSVSMAALQRFTSRDLAAAPGAHGSHRLPSGTSALSIPYAFPKPGRYRLWVQMKHAGRIMTAGFQATVVAGNR